MQPVEELVSKLRYLAALPKEANSDAEYLVGIAANLELFVNASDILEQSGQQRACERIAATLV